MKEATIRDAKNNLPRLVREVELGAAVRLTRRGKPVAVLVSEREFERLQARRAPRKDLIAVLHDWRQEMIAKGIAFEAPGDFPRDRSPGREFSFDE